MTSPDRVDDRPAVLLVDDHPPNLVALEAVLAPLQARVVSVDSGEEALLEVSAAEFALALLDVRMPGISGFETVRLMAARHPDRSPPVIFLTAYSLTGEDLRAAYELGAVDILQKPFLVEALRAKVAVFVQLFRQREMLREKDAELQVRERDRFERELIAIVSHDLRNPLNTILLASSVLAQPVDDEGRLKIANQIRSSADRATRLISDLLDYTRLRSASSLPVCLGRANLHRVVEQALEELRLEHHARTIEHDARGPGDGVFDADRVTQVVANLVTNAVRYGSKDRSITVRSLQEGEGLRLEVHNWGPPIDEETREHLFEPLQQGRKARQAGGQGVGLGLFIVERIVHAHAGTIEVSSDAESGTTFRVTLPASTAVPAICAGELK
jgi:signal transduction histidine kinase